MRISDWSSDVCSSERSRSEFSDVYAASVLGTGKNPQGSGVLMSNISQQFNQGNINYTQNALDLAINGNGFFQVSNNGAVSYTQIGRASCRERDRQYR